MAQRGEVGLAVVPKEVLHALPEDSVAHPVEAGDAARRGGEVGGVVEIAVHVLGHGGVVIDVVQRREEHRAVLALVVVDGAFGDRVQAGEPSGEVQKVQGLGLRRLGERAGGVGGGGAGSLGVGGPCGGVRNGVPGLTDFVTGVGEGRRRGKRDQKRQQQRDLLNGSHVNL